MTEENKICEGESYKIVMSGNQINVNVSDKFSPEQQNEAAHIIVDFIKESVKSKKSSAESPENV